MNIVHFSLMMSGGPQLFKKKKIEKTFNLGKAGVFKAE